MPTNSRWRWKICTKTAKIVLLAGVSIMLIGLNSLCWQQRLVHAWKKRSKPFARSLWTAFQAARFTNKARFALVVSGSHSRRDGCCVSRVIALRRWLEASQHQGWRLGTSGAWCSLVLAGVLPRVWSWEQLAALAAVAKRWARQTQHF